MYNRYIPPGTSYGPIPQEEAHRHDQHPPEPERRQGQPPRHEPTPPGAQPPGPGSELLTGVVDTVSDFLGGLFKNFSLKNLDRGDILLILIILFLFLEGDNLDLVIALGLMLLLGLGEKDEEDEKDKAPQSPA